MSELKPFIDSSFRIVSGLDTAIMEPLLTIAFGILCCWIASGLMAGSVKGRCQ
ncbi:MAG: hypothetical protein ACYCYO_16645 [Bacilli bacterium]